MINEKAGNKYCSYADVCDVPLPEATASYRPVANSDLIKLVEDEICTKYSFIRKSDLELTVGLAAKNMQMFGAIRVKSVFNDLYKSFLNICFRNSYNMTLSLAIAGGANCWVCDNQQIMGDIVVLRKHTPNCWDDLQKMVGNVVEAAMGDFQRCMEANRVLETIDLSQDEGYEIVGVALGHKVIKPQQASLVLDEWREPSFAQFEKRNAYSLYNCFTEGVKRGPVSELIDRHAKLNSFFAKEVTAAVEPVEEDDLEMVQH